MEESSKSRMRLPTVFNWNSGIDRGQFFTQMILVLFVYFICVLIMELADPVPGTRNIPAGLAAIIALLSVTFGQAAVSRRLVNLGKSRWWMIAQLVPILNIYLICLLLFVRGKRRPRVARVG